MAATRALVAKELREHGLALAGLTALLGMTWGLASAVQSREARVLSALALMSKFAAGPLVAAALYLGHRLVVVEHFGRTQRFVEALPIRRGRMALVKAFFGLCCLEIWAMGALFAGAAAAASSEPVGGRFLAILVARMGLYIFSVWGVVFTLGLFGRLRIPVAGVLVAATLLLDRYTTWELDNFGPFALIASDTFAFERQHFPVVALVQSAVLGVAAIAAGWALVRSREGSLVEGLARRLSPRELSAMLVIAGGAVVAFAAFDKEPEPQPYVFATAKVLRAPQGTVEIAYLEDELRPAATELMNEMSPTLQAFAAAMRLPWPLPPVRVVHGPETATDQPRTIRRHREQGIVLGANLTDGLAAARTRIVALALHELIWARTDGRAGIEAKHWLLDGFALHFALHGRKPLAPPLTDADETLQRALAATELVTLSAQALRDYAMTAERLGDDLVQALAASGWRVLEARAGRERVLELARAALTRLGSGDVRDLLAEWRDPLPALFARTTRIAWESFLADWAATFARMRKQPGGSAHLRELPRGLFAVHASVEGGVGVDLQLDAPLENPTACALKHRRLPPYDLPFSDQDLEEAGFMWLPGQPRLARRIEGTYGRGERAFVALDCQLAGIGSRARLVAGRVTIP